jgi:hypothetical protein
MQRRRECHIREVRGGALLVDQAPVLGDLSRLFDIIPTEFRTDERGDGSGGRGGIIATL